MTDTPDAVVSLDDVHARLIDIDENGRDIARLLRDVVEVLESIHADLCTGDCTGD